MKKLNSQKGSATLFVLIAVFFFTTILLGLYNSNMNKLREQDAEISRIQNAYQKDISQEYKRYEKAE